MACPPRRASAPETGRGAAPPRGSRTRRASYGATAQARQHRVWWGSPSRSGAAAGGASSRGSRRPTVGPTRACRRKRGPRHGRAEPEQYLCTLKAPVICRLPGGHRRARNWAIPEAGRSAINNGTRSARSLCRQRDSPTRRSRKNESLRSDRNRLTPEIGRRPSNGAVGRRLCVRRIAEAQATASRERKAKAPAPPAPLPGNGRRRTAHRLLGGPTSRTF